MKIILIFAFLLFSFACGEETINSYNGFKVYRVSPQTEDQLHMLHELIDDLEDLDFWTYPSRLNSPVDIMVSPKIENSFQYTMALSGLKPETYIENVGKLIEESSRTDRSTKEAFAWDRYQNLTEIYDWLESLAQTYPKQVTLLDIGNSFENRSIKAVKISFGNPNKTVVIEGGIHAREWISPATVTFIINEILNGTTSAWKNISQSYDWYIIPVANPDGFSYTWTNNRLWRKTRTLYGTCNGADPNRNFDVFWGVAGTSTLTCAENYGGPKAFSEVETQAISNFITSVSDNLKVFLSFHSYSQLLLIPYGHTTEHLENYEDALTVGRKAVEALSRRYGTVYQVGNTAEILYEASGTTFDWVKKTTGVPLSYTYELRDTGKYGFVLPPEEIIPNSLEIMDSLVALFQAAEDLKILD